MNNHKLGLRKSFVRRSAIMAGTSLLALASMASQAAVIDSGTVNIPIGDNIDGVYFNLVTGLSGTAGAAVPGWDVNPYNNGTGMTFFFPATSPSTGAVIPAAAAPPQPLALGTVIGPASTFSTGGQILGTNFRSGGPQTLGFRFQNEATGAVNYGYATINTTAGTGFPAAIVRYVYENAGTAITIAGAATAPVFTYTPASGSTLVFAGGGTIGSSAAASVTVALGTPAGSGTGAAATTTLTCTAPAAPFAGFAQTITAVGAGALSGTTLSGTCIRGAAAATGTLTCSENRGGTATPVTYTLNCPLGTAAIAQPVSTFSGAGLWIALMLMFGVGVIATVVRKA